jgi:hypothetical protein
MRSFTLFIAGLAVAASTIVACGSSAAPGSQTDATTRACVPGDQKACACAGGSSGAQVCTSDGTGYGACAGCGMTTHADAGHDATARDAHGDSVADAKTHRDGTSPSDTGAGDTQAADACGQSCSTSGTAIVDCHGATVQSCVGGQACDPTTVTCAAGCQVAADTRGSVGCDFYATNMELDYATECFAAYVVNTASTPVHIEVELYAGTPLDVATFARIPSGTGTSIAYAPYDSTAGLPPGQAAVLFLAGSASSIHVPCPPGVTTAAPAGSLVQGTGTGRSFHITTDGPVSAYEMNPYGGGVAAVPGSSLLLPTTAWGTNYLAVTTAPYSPVTMDNPSVNIVASQDGTTVTILPSVALVGGGSLSAGPANMPYTFMLSAGEQAQLSQQADVSGSIIQATAPIGVMAGNACMQAPLGTSYCDHGEQMLPPVQAVGHDYAAVMFRPRVSGDQAIWHLVGLVAGTQLTYSSTPPGAPTTLSAGQRVDVPTPAPFTVTSQDSAHPFLLFEEMTGSAWSGLADTSGYGDPDFVVVVPPEQFVAQYDFFVDPTFPEANLVVTRAMDAANQFDDVTLDCAGTLTGWQAVGAYEWTRIDLVRHDFVNQGACSSGAHTMTSAGPFGVTVWGWGTPETTSSTENVSYGYPAGMHVAPVNSLVLAPTPQ